MSVSLTPSSSLGFNRPLTQLVKRILTVTNNNVEPVAFKVKTTAPKLYCVRPNSGRIDPGGSVEVQVLLQAMKEEPPSNVKCKDKFLVQSTLITSEKESLPLHDLWNTLDGEESKVHQQKIKVVYLPPVGQAVEEEDESLGLDQSSLAKDRSDAVHQSPVANGSVFASMLGPTSHYNGDQSFPPEPQAPLERAISPAADYLVAREESHDDDAVPNIPGVLVDTWMPRAPSPPSPVVAAPAQAQPQLSEAEAELHARLNEAQAEIERLRSVLATMPDPNAPGLRRRNKALSDDGTAVSDSDIGGMVEQMSPEGVPPQVVIMIALGVFVTTYLFF